MHYDQQEWLAFFKEELPGDRLEQMESHLATCDQCRELFLNCIGQPDTEQAALSISPDFTRSTMELIKTTVKPSGHRVRSSRQKRQRMLLNYVAAAAVTIILAGGGFFQSLTDQAAQLPQENDKKVAVREGNNILLTWPSLIESSTNQWINDVSFTKLKEVKW